MGIYLEKIILNIEKVLFIKVFIVILFRIGEKGGNKVFDNKGNLSKLW